MRCKKYVIAIYTVCLFICCLLFLNSTAAVQAAREGARLWYSSVLPTLLPFFVFAHILQGLGFSPLEKASQIFLCLISGAPAGAKLMGSDDPECTPAVAILNTVSPMFIYSACCCQMLGMPKLAFPIIVAQTAAALIFLCILKPVFPKREHCCTHPLKLLSGGLTAGISSMLGICAAMIFFMAAAAAISQTGLFAPVYRLISGLLGTNATGAVSALFTGMLEMVSGAKAISLLKLPVPVIAAMYAFVFSFGGICIFAQSVTLCRLSLKVYFRIKLLQALLSAALAFVFALFTGGPQWVFNPIAPETVVSNALSLMLTLGISLAAISLVMLMGAAARLRKRK